MFFKYQCLVNQNLGWAGGLSIYLYLKKKTTKPSPSDSTVEPGLGTPGLEMELSDSPDSFSNVSLPYPKVRRCSGKGVEIVFKSSSEFVSGSLQSKLPYTYTNKDPLPPPGPAKSQMILIFTPDQGSKITALGIRRSRF